jgi:hypothetical protein
MSRLGRNSTTLIACALASGALAGPAVAQQDMRSPDTVDLASTLRPHRIHDFARERQDARSPDTKDVADGRSMVASTPFEVVKVRQAASGFHWGDAAIGAAGGAGIILLGVGGMATVGRRRYRSAAIAH